MAICNCFWFCHVCHQYFTEFYIVEAGHSSPTDARQCLCTHKPCFVSLCWHHLPSFQCSSSVCPFSAFTSFISSTTCSDWQMQLHHHILHRKTFFFNFSLDSLVPIFSNSLVSNTFNWNCNIIYISWLTSALQGLKLCTLEKLMNWTLAQHNSWQLSFWQLLILQLTICCLWWGVKVFSTLSFQNVITRRTYGGKNVMQSLEIAKTFNYIRPAPAGPLWYPHSTLWCPWYT